MAGTILHFRKRLKYVLTRGALFCSSLCALMFALCIYCSRERADTAENTEHDCRGSQSCRFALGRFLIDVDIMKEGKIQQMYVSKFRKTAKSTKSSLLSRVGRSWMVLRALRDGNRSGEEAPNCGFFFFSRILSRRRRRRFSQQDGSTLCIVVLP